MTGLMIPCINFLMEKDLTNVTVEETTAGIEDRFLELMEKDCKGKGRTATKVKWMKWHNGTMVE